MRLRLFTLALLCAFFTTACGGNASPERTSSDPGASDGTEAATPRQPVEMRTVSDDPSVRQRLSPPQLLAYFPDAIGERQPRVSARRLRDDPDDEERGASVATVDYSVTVNGVPHRVGVTVRDFTDDPQSLQSLKEQTETGRNLGGYGDGQARTPEHGVGRTYAIGESPWLYVVLADRFSITLDATGRGADVSTDDLWDMYQESGLVRLAGAPVYSEHDDPGVPAWAAEAVEDWRAENAAEEVAEADASSEAVADAVPLAPCDALLPPAEVERICGASGVRVVATDFEQQGRNCNRVYKAGEGPSSGLVFLATRYATAEPASRAVEVASEPSEWTVEHDQLPDLGDGGFREKSAGGSTPDRYEVSYALDNVLIEMNASDSPFDRPEQKFCLSLDQMEALARSVAERLAE